MLDAIPLRAELVDIDAALGRDFLPQLGAGGREEVGGIGEVRTRNVLL